MIKRLSIIIWASFLLILLACSPPKQNVQSIDFNFSVFDSKSLSKVEIDYSANCRIRLKTPEQSNAGVCQIILTEKNQFRLNLFYPTGGLITMVYMDPDWIEFLNREQKTLIRLPNNLENRKKILSMPALNIKELREVLWGRKFIPADSKKVYSYENNLLKQIESKTNDSWVKVTFQEWLDYKNTQFPKIINILEEDRQIDLKLVITEFKPGLLKENIKISLPKNYKIVEQLP